jgi:hypothetical protein
MLESVGGKLHHHFFAFGEHEVVILYEAPDHASAAAPLFATVGAGTVTASKTTVLMTMDEAMAALSKGDRRQQSLPGARIVRPARRALEAEGHVARPAPMRRRGCCRASTQTMPF